MNDKVFKNRLWRRVRSVVGTASVAPRLGGVYAYAEVEHVWGLPARFHWRYVGRAKNLSHRLDQHEQPEEVNGALRAWLHAAVEGKELWYVAIPDLHERASLERWLIRRIRPDFNRVLYTGEQNGQG